MREPGLERGPEDGGPPTRERREDAEDPKAVGKRTDHHAPSPATPCVWSRRRLRGCRRVEEVTTAAVGN